MKSKVSLRCSIPILISVLFPVAVAAQEGKAPEPVAIIASALELSEEQVMAFVGILHSRNPLIERLAKEARLREEALARALENPNADAATIGNLVLEVRRIHRQIAMVIADSRAQFEQILTFGQREKLQFFRSVAPVCHVLPAFGAAGLL